MTDVITAGTDTGPVTVPNMPPAQADGLDEQLVGQLVEQARANGLRLTGEGGLLQRLTKLVVESALDHRPPWLRQARSGRAEQRQQP